MEKMIKHFTSHNKKCSQNHSNILFLLMKSLFLKLKWKGGGLQMTRYCYMVCTLLNDVLMSSFFLFFVSSHSKNSNQLLAIARRSTICGIFSFLLCFSRMNSLLRDVLKNCIVFVFVQKGVTELNLFSGYLIT